MSKTILYIEDEPAQFALMKIQAERLDTPLELVHAATAEDALSMFDPAVHDLVLCDYNLPGTEAPDIAAKILEKSPNTPILAISEAFTDDRIEKAKAAGIAECIEKSDMQTCLEKIRQLAAA